MRSVTSVRAVRTNLSAYAFARQRDWVYVVLTIVVLGVLLYGLLGGPPD